MNKRIILSMLSILTTLSLVSGATFAYFNDTEDSSGNVITAGTLGFGSPVDATWTSANMAPGQTLSGNYSMDNVGTIAAEHLEILTANATGAAGNLHEVLEVTTMLYGYDSNNDGDVSDEVAGNVVDIIAVIVSGTSNIDGSPAVPAIPDPDYTLVLESAVGGSTDVAQIDANNDGKITLDELDRAADAGGSLVIEVRAGDNNQGLASGTDSAFYATLSLPAGTGNAYQGKANTLTWTYTLNQDASQ